MNFPTEFGDVNNQPTNPLIPWECQDRSKGWTSTEKHTYSHKIICHTLLFIYGRNPPHRGHAWAPNCCHHRQQLLRLLPRATRRRHGMLRQVRARFAQQRQQGLHSHVGAKDQVLGISGKLMEWEKWLNQ